MTTPPASTAPHPTGTDSLPVPTAEQIAAYRRDGFLIVRDLVPSSVLDAAERGMERFYAGDHDRPFPGRTRYDDTDWSPGDGPDVLRKNDYASLMVDELHTLVAWPGIARFAAGLAGADGMRLWHDQLLYKPPAPASERTTQGNVGWHTDRQYWLSCSSQEMLTCWVPFHDCDDAMGGVAFQPGSHREVVEGLDFFDRDLSSIDVAGTVVPRLRRGDVTFHHCGTVHGSGPNHTDRARRSMAIHLQPEDNQWVPGPGSEPAYHRNDELVGTVDGHPDYADPRVCPRLWPVG